MYVSETHSTHHLSAAGLQTDDEPALKSIIRPQVMSLYGPKITFGTFACSHCNVEIKA